MKDRAIYVYRDGGWNDNYENSAIYHSIESQITAGVAQRNIPVSIGSQAIADAMGVPLHTNVGYGTYDENNLLVNVDLAYQDLVESLLNSTEIVSMSSRVVTDGDI